jgi:ribosome biogenesis GTPase A
MMLSVPSARRALRSRTAALLSRAAAQQLDQYLQPRFQPTVGVPGASWLSTARNGLVSAPIHGHRCSPGCCHQLHAAALSTSSPSSATSIADEPLGVERVLSHVALMEHWACSGCGVDLQHEDPAAVGYLPKRLLGNIHDVRELKKLRCERCFQMKQYGKISDAKLPYREYERRVLELRAKDLLMIQLVDILDISGSLLPKARHVFGNKPVMLVVNKGDLIPQKSGIRRLMRRIKAEATAAGINDIVAIYLVSAMKSIGMREIMADVKKHRKGRDICVVGAANVGKSTFLNSFLSFLVDRKWQHNHRKYMKLAEVTLEELQDENARELLNLDASDVEIETPAAQSEDETASNLYVAPGEDPEMVEESGEEGREMTTSPLPGTTLAVQHLPVMLKNEVFNILDTPGLITDVERQRLVEVLALDGAARLTNVFPTKQLPVRLLSAFVRRLHISLT